MVKALGTWFAGIATAGSLWLGFSILKSDRSKEERTQAAKIAVVAQQIVVKEDDRRAFYLDVRVWNYSDRRPIFNTSLWGVGTDPDDDDDVFQFSPGQRHTPDYCHQAATPRVKGKLIPNALRTSVSVGGVK